MADEREPEEQVEEVEDLDVPESDSEDVKGGALNAYNKIGISPVANKVTPDVTSFQPGGVKWDKI